MAGNTSGAQLADFVADRAVFGEEEGGVAHLVTSANWFATLFMPYLSSSSIAKALRVNSGMRSAFQSGLHAELLRWPRQPASLSSARFHEIAASWVEVVTLKDDDGVAQVCSFLSERLVLTASLYHLGHDLDEHDCLIGVAQGPAYGIGPYGLNTFWPIRCLEQLRSVAPPLVLVFATETCMVSEESYAKLWSAHEEEQREALQRLTLKGEWNWPKSISELLSGGLLSRAMSLLSSPRMQLHALRMLGSVFDMFEFNHGKLGYELRQFLSRHWHVLADCFCATDAEVSKLALNIFGAIEFCPDALNELRLCREPTLGFLQKLVSDLPRQLATTALTSTSTQDRERSVWQVLHILLLLRQVVPFGAIIDQTEALVISLEELILEFAGCQYKKWYNLWQLCQVLSWMMARDEVGRVELSIISSLLHILESRAEIGWPMLEIYFLPLQQVAEHHAELLINAEAVPSLYLIMASMWPTPCSPVEQLIRKLFSNRFPAMLLGPFPLVDPIVFSDSLQ